MIASNSLSAFSASATSAISPGGATAPNRAPSPIQPVRDTQQRGVPAVAASPKGGVPPSANLPRGSLLDMRV